jgi:cytochrome P450
MVTTYEACNQIFRNPLWTTPDSDWRARQGSRWTSPASTAFGRMLMVTNPPEHTRQRQALGNAFGRATLQSLGRAVQARTDRLLDRLAERLRDGEADFVAGVGDQLPAAAIGTWLGVPPADFSMLRDLTHEQAYAQELFPSPAQLARADVAALELQSYFAALVAERRRSPGEDVLSGWIRTWDGLEEDRDAADDIVRRLATFVVMAGLETTSNLLASVVWLVAGHPGQMRWLRRNPEAVPDAVEEALRFDPPVQVSTRIAGRDTEIDGTPIAEGQLVYVMMGAAHHDPECVPDPDRFDLRRRGRHLAFGGGIHYCMGAGLAKMEATIVLRAMLARLPELAVSSPPRWDARVAFRRMLHLPISVDHDAQQSESRHRFLSREPECQIH